MAVVRSLKIARFCWRQKISSATVRSLAPYICATAIKYAAKEKGMGKHSEREKLRVRLPWIVEYCKRSATLHHRVKYRFVSGRKLRGVATDMEQITAMQRVYTSKSAFLFKGKHPCEQQ